MYIPLVVSPENPDQYSHMLYNSLYEMSELAKPPRQNVD